jgi:NADH:ubiquinone oxidoreductase subunit E
MEVFMDKFTYLKEIELEKSNLIKGLQLIQKNERYISDEAIIACSNYFKIPQVEVEGVLSFYAQFKRKKPGDNVVTVCDGTACHIKGSTKILDWIASELGIGNGETDKDGVFSLSTVACLGCCSLAPVMSINGKVFGKLDRKTTLKIIREYKKKGAK